MTTTPFDDELPPGWSARLEESLIGPEAIVSVWDEQNRNIGFFKLDRLKPILFTADDHLIYICARYEAAKGRADRREALSQSKNQEPSESKA